MRPTLPCSAVPITCGWPGPCRRDLPPGARGGAVKCRVFRGVPPVPNTDLLQRPVTERLGSIGFGVRELLLVRVQEARNVALGGFPAEFPVECGD